MGVDLKLNGTIQAAGYAGGPVSGTTGTFTGALAGPLVKMTAEGGIAVRLINKTGAASVKGTIVSASTATDGAFVLSPLNSVGVAGVVYESGIADASLCWVVVKGIAEVLFTNNVTHGMYARIGVDADDGEAAGYAVGAAKPANTFNTDVYLARFGAVLKSTSAGALTTVLLD